MQWIISGIEILRSRMSLAVMAGMTNTEWPRRTDKSRTLKQNKQKLHTSCLCEVVQDR